MNHGIQRVQAAVLENTESFNVDVNLFYIVDFGGKLTADGDVFFSFTPSQAAWPNSLLKALLKPQ
jgi:hypothetical protein